MGQAACYRYVLLLELFGKSGTNLSYLWFPAQIKVFNVEFQQDFHQPIMSAVQNYSRAALWFFSLINLAFFYIMNHCKCIKKVTNLTTHGKESDWLDIIVLLHFLPSAEHLFRLELLNLAEQCKAEKKVIARFQFPLAGRSQTLKKGECMKIFLWVFLWIWFWRFGLQGWMEVWKKLCWLVDHFSLAMAL